MRKIFAIGQLAMSLALLPGCTDNDVIGNEALPADARELQGIEAVIYDGTGSITRTSHLVPRTSHITRAGTVTPLADYVGRNEFKSGDKVVFTEIRRTLDPIINFTYPDATYDGICFKAGSEGGWQRDNTDGGPERVFWTDAVSNHKFVAYGIPQVSGYDWKTYKFTQQGTQKTYYIGSLGDPTVTTVTVGDKEMPDSIDYSLTPEEQATYTVTENNKTVYKNPKLENEDLVIAYDEEMMAEPGGSVALVKFHHALSSVRVVVNISGFSSSSSAADNNTVVSNMRLLHQPTMYIWEQSSWGAQPMRASRGADATFTDQDIINTAWSGSATIPEYSQRKNIKLWIPQPEGNGDNQSKTFTFYGITTPQPQNYISTLAANDVNRKVELKFDVTYPDPMKPSKTKTHTYTASLVDDPTTTDVDENVYFNAGYNTTINISLNHRNEKMTVGAEYENWQFVATPDEGQLKKNSTFLQDLNRNSVTIVGDEKATIDDATWLYKLNNTVYDIYGHKGDTKDDAYQISTAYQLLSFAYEVKNGRTFENKFIRLDADITLQQTSELTKAELNAQVDGEDSELYNNAADAIEWIGIGDADHAFNGTFLGGKRFIYRLKGSPLFYKLGENARIEQLQVNTVHKPDGSSYAVEGSGMYANTNAGLICGCKVVGDVAFNASTAGAFVGTNESTGRIWCCYHIGLTAASASVGGLVGTNNGIIASCYQAGKVTGTTTGGITASNSGTLDNNYYNQTLLTPTYTPEIPDGASSNGVIPKSSSEMTKQQFVTDINAGINTWRTDHPDKIYDDNYSHQYVYQPANYPKLN